MSQPAGRLGWMLVLGIALVAGAPAGCDRARRPTGATGGSSASAAARSSHSNALASSASGAKTAATTERPAAPESIREFGRMVNHFALALDRAALASTRESGKRTLVFSPLGAFLALGLAHLGADGKTREELGKVLYGGLESDGRDPGVGELLRFLKRLPDVRLEIANAYWVAEGLRIRREFEDAARDQFLAEGANLDFKGDLAGATTRINSWFDERTRHLIPRVVPEGGLESSTSAVLTNAVYFLGPWATPFDATLTRPGKFTESGGRVVDVQLMRRLGSLPYAETPFGRGVVLPYAGGDLGMLVVLPHEPNWVSRPLPADLLENLLKSVQVRSVEIAFPRFDVQASLELGGPLAAMGATTAFGETADFGGLVANVRVRLSAAYHQARVRVEEKGTEAAAATALGLVPGSPAAEPVNFVVDRPFLFVIRSEHAGIPLFLGRVRTL